MPLLLRPHRLLKLPPAPSSTRNIALVGKHILQPTDLSCTQTKAILWTAFELKKLSGKNCLSVSDTNRARVTLLMHKPSVIFQTAVKRAVNLLKADLSTVIDAEWDTEQFMQDAGKFFSMHTDAILCQTNHQLKLGKACARARTPFICIKSYLHDTMRVLSDMMALQERFGHLSRLNLACVGIPCGRINTYLCVAPKLGLNLQFYCCKGAAENKVSPAKLQEVKKLCDAYKVHLQETETRKEVFHRAHVVATSAWNPREMKVTREDLKSADPEHVILHGLPRGDHEVEKELHECQRNLVWQSSKNMEYVIAAAVLRVMRKYEHITEKPDFEKLRRI